MNLPYAEDVNYWKTASSSADTWIERTIKQINALDGKVLAEAFGKDASGRSAFMIAFEIEGNRFKIVWPVLLSKTGNEKAARIQAATMLFHDVKARCLSAIVLGARSAFFSYILLPDGRSAVDLAYPDLAASLPELFLPRGYEK